MGLQLMDDCAHSSCRHGPGQEADERIYTDQNKEQRIWVCRVGWQKRPENKRRNSGRKRKEESHWEKDFPGCQTEKLETLVEEFAEGLLVPKAHCSPLPPDGSRLRCSTQAHRTAGIAWFRRQRVTQVDNGRLGTAASGAC